MVKTSCHNMKGTELKKCQTRAKRALIKKYGGSSEKEVFPMWGRTSIKPEVGIIVPIPPQGDWFVDFKKKNAQKLISELKKLTGEPVILTGGGGYGHDFAFLDEVNLIQCDYPPLRDENNFPVKDKQGNVILNKKKGIECSVEVSLKTFEGKKFSPHIGSWRITALHGYGSNRLTKEVPRSWKKK